MPGCETAAGVGAALPSSPSSSRGHGGSWLFSRKPTRDRALNLGEAKELLKAGARLSLFVKSQRLLCLCQAFREIASTKDFRLPCKPSSLELLQAVPGLSEDFRQHTQARLVHSERWRALPKQMFCRVGSGAANAAHVCWPVLQSDDGRPLNRLTPCISRSKQDLSLFLDAETMYDFPLTTEGYQDNLEKNCLFHVAVYISPFASGHGTWHQQAFVEYPCQNSSSRGLSEFNSR